MAQNLVPASQHWLPVGMAVDAPCLSLSTRRRTHDLVIPSVVANSSTYTGKILINKSKVVAVSICWFSTVPAQSGGTTTIQVDAVAADGSTTVVVVTAVTILTGQTAKVPLALTLAATNPASLAAGTSLLVTVTSSNNTVQTSGAGYGTIGLQVEPVEPDPIVSA